MDRPRPPLLWPLRDLASATTGLQHLPGHRLRMTIDHRPLAGVTPQMLLGWFRTLGDTMSYDGRIVDRYLAWHPVDHVRWELARPAPGGGVGVGARFRIVEAFGGRPEFAVDSTEVVEKLDETGIRLVRRVAGVPIVRLEHTWSACAGATHYVSVLDIGAPVRMLGPLNRHLTRRRFPEAMGRAWLRHNVEEVGRLEHLLPGLDLGAGVRRP